MRVSQGSPRMSWVRLGYQTTTDGVHDPTTSLPFQSGEVLLSAFPNGVSKLADLFSTLSLLMLNVKQESWEYQFLGHWFDPTRNRNHESTIPKADALSTRPSGQPSLSGRQVVGQCSQIVVRLLWSSLIKPCKKKHRRNSHNCEATIINLAQTKKTHVQLLSKISHRDLGLCQVFLQ